MNRAHRLLPVPIVLFFALAGCSGGSSSGSPPAPGVAAATQQVSGTLAIGNGSTATATSASRKPAYVSGATTHVYVFINGSATPNNASSACTGTTTSGTGTFCTIAWTASLAVPHAYTFAVETDNGTSVLAEGSASYAIVAGTNTLAALTLNGVVAQANFVTGVCSNVPLPGNCSGNVTLQDAAGNAISYNGATTVPTAGASPTTGTIFDNGSVTFTATANGLVTGTAQAAAPNVYSTFAANTLTASGVLTTAIASYTYKVQCATATTSGVFAITVGGGTTPSGIVTSAQLSSETPVPIYPAAVTTVATAPNYACAVGLIASASGTLPIN